MKHLIAAILSVIFLLSYSSDSEGKIRRRGDWESSGDIALPHIPTGPINYKCTLSVSYTKGNRHIYATSEQIFTTQDFRESGWAQYTSTGNEDWDIETDLDVLSYWLLKDALVGQNYSIHFHVGPEEQEVINVRFILQLKVNGVTTKTTAYADSPRAGGKSVRASTSFIVENKSGVSNDFSGSASCKSLDKHLN